jgi:hypothetical protein
MQGLELLVIVPVVIAPVDSPKGSISPSTFVPQGRFAHCSLRRSGIALRSER